MVAVPAATPVTVFSATPVTGSVLPVLLTVATSGLLLLQVQFTVSSDFKPPKVAASWPVSPGDRVSVS